MRTWLHVSGTVGKSASDIDNPTSMPPNTTTNIGASNQTKRMPVRSNSLMRNWASPNIKKGRTLTKTYRPSYVPAPPPPPRRRDSSTPSHPQTPEPVLPEPLEQRPCVRFDEVTELQQGPGRYTISRPLELDGLVPSNQRGSTEKAVYWPLDLLPDTFPDARVFTFGYETLTVEGHLVPGQMDVFERGRQLLEAMEELRRVGGAGREVVFVAHSTGAIIVKEVCGTYSWCLLPFEKHQESNLTLEATDDARLQMLRLASTFSDTQSDTLLASIAGAVFLGAPLRSTTYGNMVAAMKSMASETTGVPEDDEVLAELLGGGDFEIEHLASLGCESFERVWMEFNFRVKTFHETTTNIRTRPWPEWGLVSEPLPRAPPRVRELRGWLGSRLADDK